LEQFRSDIQLLLNKLTIEKFTAISEKLTDIMQKIDDYTLMAEAVSLLHNTVVIGMLLFRDVSFIYSTHLLEYRFVSMYADLCKLISPKCKSIVNTENGKTVTFRQILLNKCQVSHDMTMYCFSDVLENV
jgi:hypothetical protein